MRICTHGRQTGGREINQTATFWRRLFYKTLVEHLHSVITFFYNKVFLARFHNKRAIVHEGPGYPSNQPHRGVIFSELAYWLLKRIIKVIASQ